MNGFPSRSRLSAAVLSVAVLLGAPPDSQAVQVDPGHRGQTLIVPLFVTRNGFGTLLTVMTTADSGYYQALKVNFRGPGGDLLESINVYLEREDSWVASLSPADAGATRLEIPDDSCTLAGRTGNVASAKDLSLPADYGFVEIVEMGGLDASGLQAETGGYDCQDLAGTWNAGSWNTSPNRHFVAPVGNLSATAALVNVDRGTMYSMQATALEDFSDIPQHTEPGSGFPDLSAAHDQGTESGGTQSVVCTAGECVEDAWAAPEDAVSAALSARELIGEYVLDPAIGAQTEFVVTYPTRRFHEDVLANRLGRIPISAFMVDREGVGVHSMCFMPVEYHCTTTTSLSHSEAVHSVGIDLDGQGMGSESVASPILGLEQQPVRPYYRPEPTGRLRLGYPFSPFVVSNDGTRYSGMPVIGVVLQEFVNGTLTGEGGAAVKANYGNAFSLIRKPDIEDFQSTPGD